MSLFHTRNAGPSSSTTRDGPADLYVCTAGCDRRSHIAISADTSLSVPITTAPLQRYVRCLLEFGQDSRKQEKSDDFYYTAVSNKHFLEAISP